jgi:hypothetical protein
MKCPPILFCVFNRPNTTKQVFDAISQAKPERLYVAADGPRLEKSNEVKLCEEVRKIATSVNWPCTVKILFRDKNLGCTSAISQAIDWFFEQEESGIILEDDCCPSSDFFPFCQELLERYEKDERIMHIAGHVQKNATQWFKKNKYPFSYSFIGVMHCWGWATWRRAWLYFKKYNSFESIIWRDLGKVFSNTLTKIYYFRVFHNFSDMTWDWGWSYTIIRQHGICICPKVNLIRNLGFESSRIDTVVTEEKWKNNDILENLEFPLTHPNEVYLNRELADNTVDSFEWLRSLPRRFIKKFCIK